MKSLWHSEAELERRAEEYLGPSTDIDSPNGRKAQSMLLLLNTKRLRRQATYTFWCALAAALAALANLVVALLTLAR
jgi:hypothetical protein